MKKYLLLFIILISTRCQAQDWSAWKNFYGVTWHDTGANFDRTCRYAKSMGYNGVILYNSITTAQVNAVANRSGLKFYLWDPDQNRYTFTHSGGTQTQTGRSIHWDRIAGTNTDVNYNPIEISFYQASMAWGTPTTWATQLIPAYYATYATDWFPIRDYQQQAEITDSINQLITTINSYKNDAIGFSFGGVVYDVPRIEGAFHFWNGSVNQNTDVSYYNPGTMSCALHGTITHEFPTYQAGLVNYYGKLMNSLRANYGTGNVHWISEPAFIYSTTLHTDEWVYNGSLDPNYQYLQQDLYVVEDNRLDRFLTEPNIFNSPQIPITKSMVGSAEAILIEESAIRTLACEVGAAGAWYSWSPQLPNSEYTTIENVPDRIKMAHFIPNCINLIGIPVVNRGTSTDNGTVSFHCENPLKGNRIEGYMSNKVYMARSHWDPDREIRMCLLVNDASMGTATLNPDLSENVLNIWTVNSYYEKQNRVTDQFTVTNNVLAPKASFSVLPGTGTGLIVDIGTKGKMYASGGRATRP